MLPIPNLLERCGRRDDYPDYDGVQMPLESYQLAYGLDNDGCPSVRFLRVRPPLTAQIAHAFTQEALRTSTHEAAASKARKIEDAHVF